MKPSAYLVAALLVHSPLSAYSEAPDANDCKRIADDTHRLACYDRFFQRDASDQAVHVNGNPKIPEQPSVAGAELGAEKLPTPPATDIETRLVGDFTGWSGKTVFTLGNGEVWQQTNNYISDYSPRNPITRPKVTITKSMFGSYNMRIEGVKRTVQVKRVQ